MTSQLWHKDIVLPPLPTLTGRVPLRYSHHALQASENDRYGNLRILKSLTLDRCEVIEVETQGKQIIKFVLRCSYSETLDIVFAVIPGREWFVKTVWGQEKNDLHKTLNRSRYVGG